MSEIITPHPEESLPTEAPAPIHEETESSIPDTPEPSESFDKVLADYERANSRRTISDDGSRNNQINGVVVSITSDAVLVDIGYKTEGTLPLSLFVDPITGKGEAPAPSATSSSSPARAATKRATTTSRCTRSPSPKTSPRSKPAFASGSTISGTVTAVVKGGLTVDVGVRAFMPASRSGARDAADQEKLVGTEILCRIIKLEADGDEVDVVVDRRVVLEEESKVTKDRLYSELAEGNTVSGTVRSLTDYGAFIDIGGVDGLLHISDISWSRVASPSDVLTAGQQTRSQNPQDRPCNPQDRSRPQAASPPPMGRRPIHLHRRRTHPRRSHATHRLRCLH